MDPTHANISLYASAREIRNLLVVNIRPYSSSVLDSKRACFIRRNLALFTTTVLFLPVFTTVVGAYVQKGSQRGSPKRDSNHHLRTASA